MIDRFTACLYKQIFGEMLILLEDGDLKTLKDYINLMIESLEVFINEKM